MYIKTPEISRMYNISGNILSVVDASVQSIAEDLVQLLEDLAMHSSAQCTTLHARVHVLPSTSCNICPKRNPPCILVPCSILTTRIFHYSRRRNVLLGHWGRFHQYLSLPAFP